MDSKEMSMIPIQTKFRCYQHTPLFPQFSEENKILTWRKLWIWLAEAEKDLGLSLITAEMIQEMKDNLHNIDWDFAQAEKKRVEHDVMAHITAFKMVCPKAAGIIHLGATAAYITDNTDLILIRDALDSSTLPRLSECLKSLQCFIEKYKSFPTIGRTHYQPASLTTVGKRASIWCQELLIAFQNLNRFRREMRFRGVQGATGTQSSFLTLFDGDNKKVEHLNKEISRKAGFDFSKCFGITGQVYTRLQDAELVNNLALLGASMNKICMDLRLLQSYGEITEPLGISQVGSTAMPYKGNPMRSERCCGLARVLMNLSGNSLMTAAEQGFERTFDDDTNRSMVLPDALLTAESMLMIAQCVFKGIQVHDNIVRKNVRLELPFLALEHVLIELTLTGISRQDAHEKIRQVSLKGYEERRLRKEVDLESMLRGEPFFDSVRDKVKEIDGKPEMLIGRCVNQIDDFLRLELAPTLRTFCSQPKVISKL